MLLFYLPRVQLQSEKQRQNNFDIYISSYELSPTSQHLQRTRHTSSCNSLNKHTVSRGNPPPHTPYTKRSLPTHHPSKDSQSGRTGLIITPFSRRTHHKSLRGKNILSTCTIPIINPIAPPPPPPKQIWSTEMHVAHTYAATSIHDRSPGRYPIFHS